MQAFNPRLHSLRGIAALAVLVFHWDALFPALGERLAYIDFAGTQWFLFMQVRFGWLGVPLFFVLSGYLLGSQLKDRSLSPSQLMHFWKRRALRIYPAMWVQLVILLKIGIWVPALVGNFSHWELVRNVLLWINMPPWWTSPINGVWWTLPIELSFYLLLPLLVLLQRKIGWVSVVIGCLCIAVAWRAGVMVAYSGSYYVNHLAILEALPGSLASFAAGFALCFISFNPSPKQRLTALLVLVAVFLGLQYWQLANNDTYWHGNWILAVWLPIVAVVIALLVMVLLKPVPGLGILSARPLVWLGEISYGIYLWHFPVQRLMTFLWPEFWNRALTSGLALLICLTLTLPLAALSYYLIERPIMGWNKKTGNQAKATASQPN